MKKILIIIVYLFIGGVCFAQSSKASLSSTKNANVSITNSDHDYALIASFNDNKLAEIKKAITDALGSPTENNDGLSVWFSKRIYTVTLRSEKLIIDLDKRNAPVSLVRKFEKMGEQIGNKIAAVK